MTKVPYIEYRKMKGFYTIEEVCDLFQMDKNQLRQKSEFYSILFFRGRMRSESGAL